MEHKKGGFQNQNVNVTPNIETPDNEAVSKHPHQHNTAPQHLRFLQYGLKIPTHPPHQHLPPNQSYQAVNSPLHTHVHHPNQQVQYQTTHRHLQPSPQYNNVNIHQNVSLSQKFAPHPHQKVNNQTTTQLYQTNQMSPNAPQVWVPYQAPPIHYHQKQNQKIDAQKPNQPSTAVAQGKPKEVIERKKSSGSVQIKSPAAKRPLEAPVTMQGWLHKQGSEGLMLWKKRWFVLSEYCLFYYKGMEEDKLLGSILLPSYKVSICKPEEKISKKYAFKCEHANMRTYVLAADSQDLMMQWVKVLSLASMMQTPNEKEQLSATIDSSSHQPTQSIDNSETSSSQQFSRQNYKSSPSQTQSPSSTIEASSCQGQQEQSFTHQPLYANAPPKPRRLNDGFSSPSPDLLDRYNPHYVEPTYGSRPIPKSSSIYRQPLGTAQTEYYPCHPNENIREYMFSTTGELHPVHSTERRTPDTYGRSKLLSGEFSHQHQHHHPTDYEDVYDEQSRYKRPMSPVAYSHVVKRHSNQPANINPIYRAYTPVEMLGPVEYPHYNLPQIKKSPVSTIARPHSADFLEYEFNHRQPNSLAVRQQPRPKSSLDINRNTNDSDNYFYSEEQYADKMRKSAQYLQRMPTRTSNTLSEPMNTKTAPISRYQEEKNTFPLMRSSTQPMQFNNLHISDPVDHQPVRSRSVLSEGSLSKEFDLDQECNPEYFTREMYNSNMKNRDYDQFTRSASARLAQTTPQMLHPNERHIMRDGERKREESMRRLLEWKQRMLQSPLNRKIQVNRAYHGKPETYHNLSHDSGYSTQNHLRRNGVDPSDCQPRNIPQYTSYSSDDEEVEKRSKDIVLSQAGRTLDAVSSKTESPTPAQTTSTTVINTFQEPEKPLAQLNHSHDAQACETCTSTYSDKEVSLTKPLKQLNREPSHLAHVSSLRSEYSNKFEPSLLVTETKSTGASVKKILAEFESKEDVSQEKVTTPEPEKSLEDSTIEENYMPMTPKKNFLSARSSTTSDTILKELEADENHYVEMTQNTGASSLLASTSEMQNGQEPYEMVCFSGGKTEPVYMELKKPGKDSSKTNPELPDILMPSSKRNDTISTKSDSSDADDEASKDLDSLDTPSQPRFSLSDTFRPASYYLGASRTAPEFHDSSDSELVSPPPIPNYPPPPLTIGYTEPFSLSLLPADKKEPLKEMIDYSAYRNSDQFFNSANSSLLKKSNIVENNGRGSTLSLQVGNQTFFSDSKQDVNKSFGSTKLSQNSDSEVELRAKTDYDVYMKRRPVSDESFNELASLECTLQSANLDRFLNDFHISNMSLASNDDTSIDIRLNRPSYEYENLVLRGYKNDTVSIQTAKGSEISSEELIEPKTTTRMFPDSEFFQMMRPESRTSASADISSIIQDSNCSTPIIDLGCPSCDIPVGMYMSDKKDQPQFCPTPAPYYYSDLSINTLKNDSVLTLNNQREATIGGKKDITHIINPIRCNSQSSNIVQDNSSDSPFKLAAEARSASVDFLNLTDKSGSIDEKNIYESNTLKWQKSTRSSLTDPKVRNMYPPIQGEKFSSRDIISSDTVVRRSHSLEGLLENVLTQHAETSTQAFETDISNGSGNLADTSNLEGSYLWEEDSIWRERLRSASHRHTQSMEDLDCIGDDNWKRKKPSRAITRGVVYVNDNFIKLDKHQKELENEKTLKSEIESKKEGNFVIDREKLRQWDLLSSAPSDDQLSTNTAVQAQEGNNIVVELGEGICDAPDISEIQDAASGSISINTREMPRMNSRDNTFPRAIPAKKVWTLNPQLEQRPMGGPYRNAEKEQFGTRTSQAIYMNRTSSHPDLDPETRKENWPVSEKINVSAGELLGRTHEELVLLLIQLRRRSAQTLQAIENCYNEIDTIQAQLQAITDQARRMENLQKLEQIKKHLIELEKQYEKGKPLVNLVDNMVKLGSLYRVPTDRSNYNSNIRDRIQFNQQIQESRLLSEEKRDWDRVNPNDFHLQDKVQQLYQLDRLIHEESKQLQNLQQDKEDIEHALGGLRRRLNKGLDDPAEIEHARQQQIILENELSRVHLMLAQNSKKLEETVAGNARLEQELLVLKQKLQTTKQQRSSQQYSNAGDSLTCTMDSSVTLESDLQRVQKKIGDLQKQRQELSIQVKQLTDRSSSLSKQKTPVSSMQNTQLGNKKKIPSLWRETDLDTMSIIDHGDSSENSATLSSSTIPLYINTDMKKLGDSDFYVSRNLRFNDSTSDTTSINSSLPQEKQEIKTVRIIKRESERRQRDREKSTTLPRSDTLIEEDDSSQCSSVLFRPTPLQKVQSVISLPPATYEDTIKEDNLASPNSVSNPNLPQCFERDVTSSTDISTDKSPELSPVFKSEAARQIITEVSDQDIPKQKYNRRAIPKEKRRHYTAPHNHLMKSLNQLPTDNNAFDKMVLNTRRARDDLDMERALRQRIDAPDVVRSTLSNKELKYNENTIDNILGTPNKINIPERYIPEQLPQLSAEEREYRLRKVESIKKMLSESAIISTSSTNLNTDDKQADHTSGSIMNKATTKMIEEKKQREHLLQLNQILAKQVMEMSKIVAVKALERLPLQKHQISTEEDDSSPLTPLPIYQQRDNYYS